MTEQKQGFCNKCGRNYFLDNVGTLEKPLHVLPVHKIKSLYSKKQKLCRGSSRQPEFVS